uniref:two component sensor kinase n=1 Tax=Madagascaria erythrocladioides TaxID=753684 RepID=UPI001BEFB7B1|nr:two component sensor kinase [Madagascaria erythrocladioides]QUE29070.1 dfr [Madagascaria erythrocladioides]UNJ16626.1 two component sensor kinase [Madagascaria erythrocladioides]
MIKSIRKLWSNITLQTRLTVISTFCVSLIMSSLSFWALNSIKEETKITDRHFVQDFSLLLTTNVIPLIEDGLYENLVSVSQRFYSSTSSIRYIIYLDSEGEIYFSIPVFNQRQLFTYDYDYFLSFKDSNPKEKSVFVLKKQYENYHQQELLEVTNIFLDLYSHNKNLGFLILGLNPNPTIVNSSQLTRNLSVIIFLSIWLIVIMGVVFNTLTITRPINELLLGVKNIAAGKFYKRINLPFGGELGELIESFNEMAKKLQTYQEQNLEELTGEKTKLEVLVSRIADGAILLDTELRIVLINPTAIKALNLENIPVMGQKIIDYLPHKINGKLIALIEKLVKPSGKVESTFNTQEPGIGVYPLNQKTIRILLNPVVNPNRNSIKGIVMTIQDITKETQLNEAQNKFISNVSHELRTPLFNILSFLETLYEYNDSLSKKQKLEFLDIANKETKRLTRLVNDVLDLSRLESDRLYNFEYIDLSVIIEQVIRSYQLTFKEKIVIVKVEIESKIPRIYGNYDLILQSILNLVGNALKFTHTRGIISIRLFRINFSRNIPRTEKKVRIEVSDTGIGIQNEQAKKIFDRFLRIENSTHTLQGTGLGLAIVKNCINKHKSNILLRSESNNGSTFWFDL